MISCTEFIPAYSELFSYIEDRAGRDAVDLFWDYLFAPTGSGIPLINYVLKEGIRGCYSYWSGTLNEEAADFTMYLNERAGWFMIDMHRCPSKGRLLELKDELGITPYHDYCLHCFCYKQALDRIGLTYIYNFTGVDRAACSILIYDPKVFDGRVVVDADTLIMDRRAGDNEYFHPDFHSSMNMGVEYLGVTFGEDAVRDYLTRFTSNVYGRLMDRIAAEGLSVIREKIEDTYRKERAEDALTITEQDGVMRVSVAYCPAVRHLRSTGRQVSRWYRYTTETVMQTLARSAGVGFEMLSYDGETGRAEYLFRVGG